MIDFQFSEQETHPLDFFYEHDKLWARCTICQQTWSVVAARDHNGIGYLDLEHVSDGDALLCECEDPILCGYEDDE